MKRLDITKLPIFSSVFLTTLALFLVFGVALTGKKFLKIPEVFVGETVQEKILFNLGGKIRMINSDGTNEEDLVDGSFDHFPKFLSNQEIIFGRKEVTISSLFKKNIFTGEELKIDKVSTDTELNFDLSPDKTKVVYKKEEGIWTGGTYICSTKIFSLETGSELSFSFCPNISYFWDLDNEIYFTDSQGNVSRISATDPGDLSTLEVILPISSSFYSYPTVCGNYIFYISRESGIYKIFRVEKENTSLKAGPFGEGEVYSIDGCSPANDTLLYTTLIDDIYKLAVMDLEGNSNLFSSSDSRFGSDWGNVQINIPSSPSPSPSPSPGSCTLGTVELDCGNNAVCTINDVCDCISGYENCDNLWPNGCVDLNTDSDHCGDCITVCSDGDGETCVGGICNQPSPSPSASASPSPSPSPSSSASPSPSASPSLSPSPSGSATPTPTLTPTPIGNQITLRANFQGVPANENLMNLPGESRTKRARVILENEADGTIIFADYVDFVYDEVENIWKGIIYR